MSVTISESGMSFGPYPEEDCFQIEQSRLYERIKTGVQMAEFAVIRRRPSTPVTIWLIEAKSSAPNPDNPGNPGDFQKYIAEIHQKMANGLQVLFAAWLARHPEAESELPAGFQAARLDTLPIHCVLVINRHQKAWLQKVQEALSRSLGPVIKTMGLPPGGVSVINDDMARSRGLIS